MSIKRSDSTKLRSIPFHPFLVVSFQILTIYATNVNTANITAAMYVLFAALFATALFFILISFITRDTRRTAISVTFYAFLFFAYGRIYDVVPGLPIAGFMIGRNSYLLVLYALIVLSGTYWIFRSRLCEKHLEGINSFFNRFGFGLVLISVFVGMANFDGAKFGIKKPTETKKLDINKEPRPVSENRKGKTVLRPDVYYIIMDSYASHRVLKKYYDWDDSGVVEALRTHGFSVNGNACSNYPFTSLSIGATLNMRYVHEDRGFIEAGNKYGYLRQLITENKVMERFRAEGYQVVSNEIFQDYTLLNRKQGGEKNDASLFSDEFVALVIHVSILRIIEKELTADAMRQDVLSDLEELKRSDSKNKPTFVFSHILCPHPPYIFNADGSKPKIFESAWGRFENSKQYVQQVRFVGKQIVEIVDSIQRRDPGAVIIVQADHGHGYVVGGHLLDRNKPPLDFLDAQFGILNAMYLPPGINMPGKNTPVNLFRYLFNALFDDKLEILPDRAFFTPIKEPYVFYEVTEDINRLGENQKGTDGIQ
jgi:hypothetical protein